MSDPERREAEFESERFEAEMQGFILAARLRRGDALAFEDARVLLRDVEERLVGYRVCLARGLPAERDAARRVVAALEEQAGLLRQALEERGGQ